METKADNPLGLFEQERLPPVVAAYLELCHLKQLYRQGWLKRGVPRLRCESIAEHSFGVAALALWLAQAYQPDLDICKIMRMALLHDFGEVYAGDLIPADAISAEEKHRLEAQSVQQVFAKLPGGQSYLDTWQEFEKGTSPEARFVRQIDRLEMGLQAAVYGRQGLIDPHEFFESARQALVDPQWVEVLQAVTEK
jgi:putative hydrolase of HD superfamily